MSKSDKKLQPREWLLEDPKSGTQHKASASTLHISYKVACELGRRDIKKFPKAKLLHVHAANGTIYYFKP